MIANVIVITCSLDGKMLVVDCEQC